MDALFCDRTAQQQLVLEGGHECSQSMATRMQITDYLEAAHRISEVAAILHVALLTLRQQYETKPSIHLLLAFSRLTLRSSARNAASTR